jgi:protein-disulfide isomerase
MNIRNTLLAVFGFALLFVAVIALTSENALKQKQTASVLSAKQKEEVRSVIGEYIRAHPEIIVESFRTMQARERAKEQQRGLKNLITYRELILNDPTSPVGGNPKGDVTIVEFFDYNCGYCKQVHPVIEKLIAEDKNIRFVYKEFPILSRQSELAARAALAVWQQDKSKYVQIHQEFINWRGKFTESRILRMVQKMGLDPIRLKKDMRSSAMSKIIADNHALARQLGITGTPAFIIGNQIYPGAANMATMKKMIAAARKG